MPCLAPKRQPAVSAKVEKPKTPQVTDIAEQHHMEERNDALQSTHIVSIDQDDATYDADRSEIVGTDVSEFEREPLTDSETYEGMEF